jgi:hypothetical protein
MAQHRAWPGAKDCRPENCESARLAGEGGVNPAMNSLPSAGPEVRGDSGPGQPASDHLHGGQDPALMRRELAELGR